MRLTSGRTPHLPLLLFALFHARFAAFFAEQDPTIIHIGIGFHRNGLSAAVTGKLFRFFSARRHAGYKCKDDKKKRCFSQHCNYLSVLFLFKTIIPDCFEKCNIKAFPWPVRSNQPLYLAKNSSAASRVLKI